MDDKPIRNVRVASYLRALEGELPEIRAILLFGKNTATYKFALCHALMQMNPRDAIKYDDLKDEFLRALVAHHQRCPHQFSQPNNRLVVAADKYLRNEISWGEFTAVGEQLIYNNVFDAFQNVGNGTLEWNARLFEHDKANRQIVLTDNLNSLLGNEQLKKIVHEENETRWQAVEEAWRAGISTNLVYDPLDGAFYINDNRKNLRSAVSLLGPYQKGRCFYCSVELGFHSANGADNFPDVDHVIPLSYLNRDPAPGVNPNGIWNLVLSCLRCNRGPSGKFNQAPSDDYFDKLLLRNLFFAEEHSHATRFAVLKSLGVSKKEDIAPVMRTIHKRFAVISKWRPIT